MPDSAPDIGYLSRFKIGNGGSPQVYTAIANLVSFTPPTKAFGEAKTTTLGTPGAMHTFRPLLGDPGEVPCKVYYVPGGTEESAILALFDRSTRSFEIEFPNGARQQFQGFAKGFTPGSVELEGILEASFNVRVSGEVTYIAAPLPKVPANTAVPTITGAAKVGSPLTVAAGTWAGAPTPWFSYQWKAGGTAIAGATGTVFVPTAAEVGKTITCAVIGFNQLGAVEASSVATTAVVA